MESQNTSLLVELGRLRIRNFHPTIADRLVAKFEERTQFLSAASEAPSMGFDPPSCTRQRMKPDHLFDPKDFEQGRRASPRGVVLQNFRPRESVDPFASRARSWCSLHSSNRQEEHSSVVGKNPFPCLSAVADVALLDMCGPPSCSLHWL